MVRGAGLRLSPARLVFGIAKPNHLSRAVARECTLVSSGSHPLRSVVALFRPTRLQDPGTEDDRDDRFTTADARGPRCRHPNEGWTPDETVEQMRGDHDHGPGRVCAGALQRPPAVGWGGLISRTNCDDRVNARPQSEFKRILGSQGEADER